VKNLIDPEIKFMTNRIIEEFLSKDITVEDNKQELQSLKSSFLNLK